MSKRRTEAEVVASCKRELHEALGLAMEDLGDFTWFELLEIVRKDYEIIRQVRKAVES